MFGGFNSDMNGDPKAPAIENSEAIGQMDFSHPLDRLYGGWVSLGGDFEEVLFTDDGTYSTFLAERPFDSGRWTLDGEVLTFISDADPILNLKYQIVNITDSKSEFIDLNNSEVIEWVKDK